ncbi:trafficking protein Mon1-domain-containing protein [Dipodascopsis uninucleata]
MAETDELPSVTELKISSTVPDLSSDANEVIARPNALTEASRNSATLLSNGDAGAGIGPVKPRTSSMAKGLTNAAEPAMLSVVEDYILSQELIDAQSENISRSTSPTRSLSPTRSSLSQSAAVSTTTGQTMPLTSEFIGLSKAFSTRLQSKPTTAMSYSASEVMTGTPIIGQPIATPSSAKMSVTSPVSSVASSAQTTSSDALPSTNASSIVDLKSILGKILYEQDPLKKAKRKLTTFNNSFIETDVDDDSITVFDEYNINEEEDDKEKDELERFLCQKKHYFIISNAGKPIFSLNGSDDLISSYMGVIQALVAGFEQSTDVSSSSDNDIPDTLRFFTAGTTSFAITVEDPLILVAISKMGETEGQLRTQLDALHTQLLSSLTKSQIVKVFTGRTNFDLRKLLGGAEVYLRALAREMVLGSPSILLNSIECLRLRNSVRDRINVGLLKGRTPSLLYGLIVADFRLVSVIRPKKHSLHPPDLQVIFSLLFHNTTFHDGREHWIPICLPKFNNRGFLHAYIVFFRPRVALVLISADKDAFYELRRAKEGILEYFEDEDCNPSIDAAVKLGRYQTADIGAPAIKHFLYKSRANVQFTMPNYEPHYPDVKSQHELMCLYRRLHAAIHTKHTRLKVLYMSRGNAVALAWATATFEIYCVASSQISKATLAQGMDKIIAWIRREESRLFLSNGAVF